MHGRFGRYNHRVGLRAVSPIPCLVRATVGGVVQNLQMAPATRTAIYRSAFLFTRTQSPEVAGIESGAAHSPILDNRSHDAIEVFGTSDSGRPIMLMESQADTMRVANSKKVME